MENNENMNKKCELTDDELAAVAGGSGDGLISDAWCSYESIKAHLSFNDPTIGLSDTEMACRIKHGHLISDNIYFLREVSVYMHYRYRWYPEAPGGAWCIDNLGTVDIPAAENVVFINKPSWAPDR